MKKFKIIPLILLFVFVVSAFSPAAYAVEPPELSSNAIVILETDSRTTLYSRNENVRVYPASTTKIMTVLLAVEAIEDGKVNLTDVVTAHESMTTDLIADGSSAGIVVGEQMTLQDLLYCAMLASGNDACNVIAEYIAGSIPSFVNMMNARAAELGCVGTHFANTHGLPNDNHYTTAWDFSLISLEAVSHSEFMAICDTVSYEVPATNLSERRYLSNSNGLINEKSFMYPGYKYENAHGVKTGHTSAAGYCLVSTAEKDGLTLMCVVMGGVVGDSGGAITYSNFTDSIKLYDWGFENFSFQNILTTADLVTTVDVVMGADGQDKIALKPQNALAAFLPNDTQLDSFELSITTNTSEDGTTLRAPIEAGDVLGEVKVMKDGVSYGKVKLVAAASIDMSKSSFIKGEIRELLEKLWVKVLIVALIALLVIYIVSVLMYRRRRRQYLKQMQARRVAERRRREAAAANARGNAEQARADTAVRELRENKPPVAKAPERKPVKPLEDRDYFDEFFKK